MITKKNGKWFDGATEMNPQPKNADEALQMANERLAAAEAAALAGRKERKPMQGIEAKLDGTILTMVIDLKQDHGKSASGKTTTVATSSGNVPFEVPGVGRVFVGVNAYRK